MVVVVHNLVNSSLGIMSRICGRRLMLVFAILFEKDTKHARIYIGACFVITYDHVTVRGFKRCAVEVVEVIAHKKSEFFLDIFEKISVGVALVKSHL